MIQIEGSHGTTRARASKISSDGFKVGSGRRGQGLYLWKKSYFYRELAIAWWHQKLDENRYNGDNDIRCSVIYVLVDLEKNELLNINDELQDKLYRLIKEKNIKNDNRKAAALYDLFIKKLENLQQCPFKVVEMRVSSPSWNYMKDAGIPRSDFVDPSMYLIRILEGIKISKVEHVKYK